MVGPRSREGERQAKRVLAPAMRPASYRGFPTLSGTEPGRVQGATTEYASMKRGPTVPSSLVLASLQSPPKLLAHALG